MFSILVNFVAFSNFNCYQIDSYGLNLVAYSLIFQVEILALQNSWFWHDY